MPARPRITVCKKNKHYRRHCLHHLLKSVPRHCALAQYTFLFGARLLLERAMLYTYSLVFILELHYFLTLTRCIQSTPSLVFKALPPWRTSQVVTYFAPETANRTILFRKRIRAPSFQAIRWSGKRDTPNR